MTLSPRVLTLALPLVLAACATTSSTDRQISSLKGDLRDQADLCAAQAAQGQSRMTVLSLTNAQLTAKLADEIKKGQVSLNLLDDQLRLSVMQEVLFDSGSTELRDSGMLVLDKVTSAISQITGELVTIEGHTDSMRIGPTIVAKYPTNWELSTARATTVVRYLQDKGVNPAVLSAEGFGEYRPVTTNETEAGRQLNRRIEVVLTTMTNSTPPLAVQQ
jgi:chemotaxis protein MotB